MHESSLVLPFAIAPAEHAKDLLAALEAPSLARCLSHARPGRQMISAPLAALLPHEQWLAGSERDTSPPLAHAMMQQLGMSPTPGYWFVLEPAHFHVALDHLVLTDRRHLSISDATSRALFDAAHALFAELGYMLRYGDAHHWFLRADAWSGLRTCSPDAACGHNVDVWLPRGDGERDWRRLHNEIQMLWHQHPINEEREQRGERRVNALWLWGGSDQEGAPASFSAGLRQLARQSLGLIPDEADAGLTVTDTLTGPALAGDWSGWMAALNGVDREEIAPRLQQLSDGQLDRLTLVLTDSRRAFEWQLRRASMRKFWVRTSLSRLAP